MILTDREIQISLAQNLISIEPAPGEQAYSSTSVDLTLDATLSEFKDNAAGVNIVIDPGTPGFDHEKVLGQILEEVTISDNGYDFQPANSYLLGQPSL